jgi:hypothetical protein
MHLNAVTRMHAVCFALIYHFIDLLFACVGKTEAKMEVATHLIQYVFISDCGFRFPVAHFPTTTCPPTILYIQFLEGVLQMKKAGFRYYT